MKTHRNYNASVVGIINTYKSDYSVFHDYLHCVQKKNTYSQFLSYLNEWCVDLNENYSEHTYGTVDANDVEIKYSLQLMT